MVKISYIRPLGEDYQHEVTDKSIKLHTDLYLLLNMQNIAIGDRLADDVLNRVNNARLASDNSSESLSFDDAVKSAVPEAFEDDTLNDYGRLYQGLNAQKAKVESKLKKIDDYIQSVSDSKKSAILQKQRDALTSYINNITGVGDENV